MRAVIVANGEIENSERLCLLWGKADLRLAADGGAANARRWLGLTPHALIGDLDSLDEQTHAWCEAAGVETIQYPRAKDKTDLELALECALARGASEITLLGALGGRFDQTMANVLLLVKVAEMRIPARIAGDRFDAWVAWECAEVNGRIGDTVSLIPLTPQVNGIVTRGLLYPLHQETLWLGSARGVSNELTDACAEVSFEEGILLVVHLLSQQYGEDER